MLSEAESWWRAFGLRDHLEPTWQAHGFERLTVEVLETALPPSTAAGPLPDGYRLAPWRESDLDDAARLMAAAPDPLQQRVPTPAKECRDLLARTADLSRGALAWSGERLAGIVSISPAGDIGQLYVSAEDQGRGLGGALLDAAIEQLAQTDRRRVRLTMVAGNERAWRLYRSRDFRRASTYPCRVWSRT